MPDRLVVVEQRSWQCRRFHCTVEPSVGAVDEESPAGDATEAAPPTAGFGIGVESPASAGKIPPLLDKGFCESVSRLANLVVSRSVGRYEFF